MLTHIDIANYIFTTCVCVVVYLYWQSRRARLTVYTQWNARELLVSVRNVGKVPACLESLTFDDHQVTCLLEGVEFPPSTTHTYIETRVRQIEGQYIEPCHDLVLFRFALFRGDDGLAYPEWKDNFKSIRSALEGHEVSVEYMIFPGCPWHASASYKLPVRRDLDALTAA